MKEGTHWQRFILIPLGIVAVALLLHKLDPLQLRLQGRSYSQQSVEQVQRTGPIDPLYVKGFKQVSGQYFIVILDEVEPEDCPCSDPKVRLGKKPDCPVVHHREKKAIIARGRKLGLPEYNFPVLEVCE